MTVRSLEEILQDMQAIIDKPDMTAEDMVAYLALESELAAAQAAGQAEPSPATNAIGREIRDRHNRYTTVVVPAGRPRSGPVDRTPHGPRSAHYDQARLNVDRLHETEQLPDVGADRIAALLDSTDKRQREPAAVWAALAGDPAYLSAFNALMRDPVHGHMTWTNEERVAFNAVETARRSTVASPLNALQETGWVLPASLDPAVIIANSGSISPVRSLSRNVTTATSTWRGIKTAGATAEWKAESTQAADGTPTASEIEIPLFASSCYVQWSWEVRFSASNLTAQLEAAINDALSNQLNVAWITGNGTTQPQGLVTGLAGGASEMNTSGSETYDKTDPTRMQAALPARYSAGAVWLSHLATKNAYAFMETTNGALLYPELRNDPPTLLTKRWYEASDMDGSINAAATASNFVLLYGDLGQGYITVDAVGSVAQLYDVAGANGRPTGDSGLIVWSRHGAEVVNIDAMRLLDVPTTA